MLPSKIAHEMLMWKNEVLGFESPEALTAVSRNARTDAKTHPQKIECVIVIHGNGLPRATSATFLSGLSVMRVRIEHAQVSHPDASRWELQDGPKITTV